MLTHLNQNNLIVCGMAIRLSKRYDDVVQNAKNGTSKMYSGVGYSWRDR